jgi:hypothetical protein
MKALDGVDIVFAMVVDWRALMGPVTRVHFDLDLQPGRHEASESTGEEAGSRSRERCARSKAPFGRACRRWKRIVVILVTSPAEAAVAPAAAGRI